VHIANGNYDGTSRANRLVVDRGIELPFFALFKLGICAPY